VVTVIVVIYPCIVIKTQTKPLMRAWQLHIFNQYFIWITILLADKLLCISINSIVIIISTKLALSVAYVCLGGGNALSHYKMLISSSIAINEHQKRDVSQITSKPSKCSESRVAGITIWTLEHSHRWWPTMLIYAATTRNEHLIMKCDSAPQSPKTLP